MHCSIWKEEGKGDLPFDKLQSIFENYPHFTWVDLTGGEIFLREDLVAIVETIVAKSKRLELLHFPTNGLCPRTEATIREIRKVFKGKLVITISIDGPRGLHDRIRGVNGGFDRAVLLLRNLLEQPMDQTAVYAGMTLISENVYAVTETRLALQEAIPGFKPQHLHVNFGHASPFYHNENNLKPFTGSLRTLESSLASGGFGVFAFLERVYRKLYGTFLRTGKTAVPCRSGEISLFINSCAELFPCTSWASSKGISLTDHAYSIEKALMSAEFLKQMEQIAEKQCLHCFTPCEAYQTLLSSPVKTALALLKNGPG